MNVHKNEVVIRHYDDIANKAKDGIRILNVEVRRSFHKDVEVNFRSKVANLVFEDRIQKDMEDVHYNLDRIRHCKDLDSTVEDNY